MVVAAAAVLAGPAAMWLGGSARSTSATDGHDGSSTTAAVRSDGPWSGLEPGPPPTIPYVQGTRYHAADGTVTTPAVPRVRRCRPRRTTAASSWCTPSVRAPGSPAWTTTSAPCGARAPAEPEAWPRAPTGAGWPSRRGTARHRSAPSTWPPPPARAARSWVHRVPGHHRVSLAGVTQTTVGYAYWPPRRGPAGRAFVTDFSDQALEVPTRSSIFALDPSGNEVTVGTDSGNGFAVVDVRTGAARWRSSTPSSRSPTTVPTVSPSRRTRASSGCSTPVTGGCCRRSRFRRGSTQVAGPVWDSDDTVLVVASRVDAAGSDTAIVRFDLLGRPPTLATRVVRTAGAGDRLQLRRRNGLRRRPPDSP